MMTFKTDHPAENQPKPGEREFEAMQWKVSMAGYKLYKYDVEQIMILGCALMKEVDPYMYDDPERFPAPIMATLFYADNDGLDIEELCERVEEFDLEQIQGLIYGLRHRIDISEYMDPKTYSGPFIRNLMIGYAIGFDMSKYDDPDEYNSDQLIPIIEAMKAGIDTTLIDHPDNPADEMHRLLGREMALRGMLYLYNLMPKKPSMGFTGDKKLWDVRKQPLTLTFQ